MDTGMGELAPVSKDVAKEISLNEQMSIFTTGEIVELKSSRFRIELIDRHTLVLILNILPHQT